MPYGQSLWLFFLMLVGIIALPGLDMALIVAHALRGGLRTGMAALAGVMLGGVGHTSIGFVGVAALFETAPKLFAALLTASAVYLAWIGLALLRSDIHQAPVAAAPVGTSQTAFRHGVTTCLLNPKAYLFVLTAYPLFMRPQYGPLWAQALIFGGLTAATQLGIYGSLAYAAAAGRQRLLSPRAGLAISRGVGALFLAMALWTLSHVLV
jgi:threonine/homoserine/homoserine lactone efflux protein